MDFHCASDDKAYRELIPQSCQKVNPTIRRHALGVVATGALASCGNANDMPNGAAVKSRSAEFMKSAGIDTSPVVFQRSSVPAGSVMAAATNKDEIRCYFKADLTTTYKMPTYPGTAIMPPYMGISTLPEGDSAELKDHAAACAALWDTGAMNPNGITDSLIPKGFVANSPSPPPPVSSDTRDGNGNLLPPARVEQPGVPENVGDVEVRGHYIPPLMVCVVDGTIAVIPGPDEVCATLDLQPFGQ